MGYGLLAIGYWLLAIGYWLLAIGYWLLAIQVSQLRKLLIPMSTTLPRDDRRVDVFSEQANSQ
jgi:hypothetical protein